MDVVQELDGLAADLYGGNLTKQQEANVKLTEIFNSELGFGTFYQGLVGTSQTDTILFTSGAVGLLAERHWKKIDDEKANTIKKWCLNWLYTKGCSALTMQGTFALQLISAVVRLFSRFARLGWLDSTNNVQYIRDVNNFLESSHIPHWIIAMEIYSDITVEMSGRCNMSRDRKTALSFRATALQDILKSASIILKYWYTNALRIDEKWQEIILLMKTVTTIGSVVSFDFSDASLHTYDMSETNQSVNLPLAWRPYIIDIELPNILITILKQSLESLQQSPHDSIARGCCLDVLKALSSLVSIHRAFFENQRSICNYVRDIVTGLSYEGNYNNPENEKIFKEVIFADDDIYIYYTAMLDSLLEGPLCKGDAVLHDRGVQFTDFRDMIWALVLMSMDEQFIFEEYIGDRLLQVWGSLCMVWGVRNRKGAMGVETEPTVKYYIDRYAAACNSGDNDLLARMLEPIQLESEISNISRLVSHCRSIKTFFFAFYDRQIDSEAEVYLAAFMLHVSRAFILAPMNAGDDIEAEHMRRSCIVINITCRKIAHILQNEYISKMYNDESTGELFIAMAQWLKEALVSIVKMQSPALSSMVAVADGFSDMCGAAAPLIGPQLGEENVSFIVHFMLKAFIIILNHENFPYETRKRVLYILEEFGTFTDYEKNIEANNPHQDCILFATGGSLLGRYQGVMNLMFTDNMIFHEFQPGRGVPHKLGWVNSAATDQNMLDLVLILIRVQTAILFNAIDLQGAEFTRNNALSSVAKALAASANNILKCDLGDLQLTQAMTVFTLNGMFEGADLCGRTPKRVLCAALTEIIDMNALFQDIAQKDTAIELKLQQTDLMIHLLRDNVSDSPPAHISRLLEAIQPQYWYINAMIHNVLDQTSKPDSIRQEELCSLITRALELSTLILKSVWKAQKIDNLTAIVEQSLAASEILFKKLEDTGLLTTLTDIPSKIAPLLAIICNCYIEQCVESMTLYCVMVICSLLGGNEPDINTLILQSLKLILESPNVVTTNTEMTKILRKLCSTMLMLATSGKASYSQVYGSHLYSLKNHHPELFKQQLLDLIGTNDNAELYEGIVSSLCTTKDRTIFGQSLYMLVLVRQRSTV